MKTAVLMAVLAVLAVLNVMAIDYPVIPKDIGVKLVGFDVVEVTPNLETSAWTVSLEAKFTGMPAGATNDVDVVAASLAMGVVTVCTKEQITAAAGKDYDTLTMPELRTTVVALAKTRIAVRFGVEYP